MKPIKCPSVSPTGPVVLVGRNRFGNWVVREQNGLFGGLFASREQALKYALCENGQHSEAILEVPCEIDFEVTNAPQEAVLIDRLN